MADLSFYTEHYHTATPEEAFAKFVASLQTYYDAEYYVDWTKVYANVQRYEAEYALLSTLCDKEDRLQAAQHLLLRFPQIIPTLPPLIGVREAVTILTDPNAAEVETFDFRIPSPGDEARAANRYAEFLVASGLLELLERIRCVKDYATGVEVGCDTNARKNRSGGCGSRAVEPHIDAAVRALGINQRKEASYAYLTAQGFRLPQDWGGITWDWAFWTRTHPPRLVVMEVNHYGGSGSKPPAIAREYAARQQEADRVGIGFIWVTDGLGWKAMLNPLAEAFRAMTYLVNVRLAKDGLLEHALRRLLFE